MRAAMTHRALRKVIRVRILAVGTRTESSVWTMGCTRSGGADLPSAMAAKMVHPERTVIAICGDGGFMTNSQELATAVMLGLNITVVILNDNAYGMIKWKQTGGGFTDFGLDLDNPDFIKYAEAYSAKGYRVADAAQFPSLLQHTITTPGVPQRFPRFLSPSLQLP